MDSVIATTDAAAPHTERILIPNTPDSSLAMRRNATMPPFAAGAP